MREFFPPRDETGPRLALFLNAGDPPLAELPGLIAMLDGCGVDCLELAVPFPNSATDGPVIRRSAQRALANGVGLDDVLECVRELHSGLRHLRIALFADWSHTVRPRTLTTFVQQVADSNADGVLIHALPPRLRPEYIEVAGEIGLPIVTSCYHGSTATVMAQAATHATAYLYLVAHYGRTGTAPAAGYADLAATIVRLRTIARAPIAVGFGVKSRADLAQIHQLGADAAIVGTAGVARIERAVAEHRDVIDDFYDFLRELGAHRVKIHDD